MKSLFYFLAVFLFSSCMATHSGLISTAPITTPVQYVDVAYGIVESSTFLGFGGLKKDALTLEAKQELFKGRPLAAGEAYANFIVDYKRSYYLISSTTRVTVSADIVNYNQDSDEVYSEEYKRILNPQSTLNPQSSETVKTILNDFYAVGDTVMDAVFEKAIIISMLPGKSEKAVLQYYEGKNAGSTKKIKLTYLAKKVDSYHELKLGSQFKDEGTIEAFGLEGVVLRGNDGDLLFSFYE